MKGFAYGVLLDSDVDLGIPAAEGEPDVRIVRMDGPVPAEMVRWLDRSSDPWMSAGMVGELFYLRFGAEASFLVDPDGRRVFWMAAGGVADETLVHLLLDHVIPRALTRGHRTVLHGSCIARARDCVALIGRAGSGKSTLAAALLARGHTLVADDCVVAAGRPDGPAVVVPAYPGLRLTANSMRLTQVPALDAVGRVSRFSEKLRVRPAVDGGDAQPLMAERYLAAVVVLAHPDEPAVDGDHLLSAALAPAAAGIELLRHSFHLNASHERAALLQRVLPIAATTPVFRLRYRHTDAGLDVAVEEVVELLAARRIAC